MLFGSVLICEDFETNHWHIYFNTANMSRWEEMAKLDFEIILVQINQVGKYFARCVTTGFHHIQHRSSKNFIKVSMTSLIYKQHNYKKSAHHKIIYWHIVAPASMKK